MTGKLNALADRVLARIVPAATAAACPHSYTDYKCTDNHNRFSRTCYRDVECYTTGCTPWVPAGSC